MTSDGKNKGNTSLLWILSLLTSASREICPDSPGTYHVTSFPHLRSKVTSAFLSGSVGKELGMVSEGFWLFHSKACSRMDRASMRRVNYAVYMVSALQVSQNWMESSCELLLRTPTQGPHTTTRSAELPPRSPSEWACTPRQGIPAFPGEMQGPEVV